MAFFVRSVQVVIMIALTGCAIVILIYAARIFSAVMETVLKNQLCWIRSKLPKRKKQRSMKEKYDAGGGPRRTPPPEN